jgi:hypothetical protein
MLSLGKIVGAGEKSAPGAAYRGILYEGLLWIVFR